MVPEGWKLNPFGQYFDIKSGVGFKFSEYVEEGVPLVKIDNVSHGYIKWDNRSYLPESYLDTYSDICLQEGDILLALNRPITQGKLKIARIRKTDLPAILYQRVGKVVTKTDKTLDDYFYYSLEQAVFKFVRSKSIGSDQPFISTTELKRVKILVPPLRQQSKIAQILSTWDKAITNTEQLLANSQRQKKALMQQLLTGKKRLLDENGVRFSGEWEQVKLRDVAECLDNKRVPLNSTTRANMPGEYPYWGANGIVDHVDDYIFDETIVLLAEDGGNFSEYNSRPIANISYGKSWVNNHAHILKAKTNSTNEWIYYSLVNKNILGFVNGGTRAKLNKSDMLLIPIELPSLKEQKRINIVLSEASREIEILQNKLDALKQEKKALMQQLLTGKRRVKVDEEVA